MKLTQPIKIILVVTVLLLLMQLFVSAKTGAVGNNIATLEERYLELEKENQILEQKIASASALGFIEEEARSLGLKNSHKVVFWEDTYLVVQR